MDKKAMIVMKKNLAEKIKSRSVFAPSKSLKEKFEVDLNWVKGANSVFDHGKLESKNKNFKLVNRLLTSGGNKTR